MVADVLEEIGFSSGPPDGTAGQFLPPQGNGEPLAHRGVHAASQHHSGREDMHFDARVRILEATRLSETEHAQETGEGTQHCLNVVLNM